VTPGTPYEIIYEPDVERAVAEFPPDAVRALSQVLRQVAVDPGSGTPYDTRWPSEFRTVTFGDSGMALHGLGMSGDLREDRDPLPLPEHRGHGLQDPGSLSAKSCGPRSPPRGGTGVIPGRDVLAHAVLVYAGWARQCTIMF
jgi:hypothetical protein